MPLQKAVCQWKGWEPLREGHWTRKKSETKNTLSVYKTITQQGNVRKVQCKRSRERQFKWSREDHVLSSSEKN